MEQSTSLSFCRVSWDSVMNGRVRWVQREVVLGGWSSAQVSLRENNEGRVQRTGLKSLQRSWNRDEKEMFHLFHCFSVNGVQRLGNL